jgi:hypothetical protein
MVDLGAAVARSSTWGRERTPAGPGLNEIWYLSNASSEANGFLEWNSLTSNRTSYNYALAPYGSGIVHRLDQNDDGTLFFFINSSVV